MIDAGGIDRAFHFPIFTGSINAITGVTIRHGNAGAGDGGGIAKGDTSLLTLTDVIVTANAATNGGGILNGCCAVIVLVNSRISDNFASEKGGGIFNPWFLQLQNTEVRGNVAKSGGGIFSAFESLSITDSRIADKGYSLRSS